VTVSATPSSEKEINNFGFPFVGGYITSIVGTQISVRVPAHTDVTQLVANFKTTGGTVTVNGIVQESLVTPNDFTHPVAYKVTAEDGTSQTYTVTVHVGP
jgi:hypothetical protein